ncbi:MAG TPA: tetratricopeptide repeat protein [Pirellulales bacterium]
MKSGREPRRSRRLKWCLVIAAAALAGGAYFAMRERKTVFPEIALGDCDPEIRTAIESAESEVHRRPDSADAWGQLGMLLDGHDFRAQADMAYAEAQRLAPQKPDWPYLRARSRALDDPEQIIPLLREAANRSGRSVVAPRLKLAELLMEQGSDQEAAELFQQVLAEHPSNARALLGQGRLAYAQGRLDEAATKLRQSLEAMPADKPARIVLASVLERLGDHDGASLELARSVELPDRPEWPDPMAENVESRRVGKDALLARGIKLLDGGQVAAALTIGEKLASRYPSEERVWLLQGRAQLLSGRHQEAGKSLRQAVKLAPDLVEGHLQLGLTLMQMGQLAPAAEEFRRAITLKPNLAAAHLDLGLALARQGERAEALVELRKAVDFGPHLGATHYFLAQVLAQDGKFSSARSEAQEALRLRPNDQPTRELLKKIERAQATTQ